MYCLNSDRGTTLRSSTCRPRTRILTAREPETLQKVSAVDGLAPRGLALDGLFWAIEGQGSCLVDDEIAGLRFVEQDHAVKKDPGYPSTKGRPSAVRVT